MSNRRPGRPAIPPEERRRPYPISLAPDTIIELRRLALLPGESQAKIAERAFAAEFVRIHASHPEVFAAIKFRDFAHAVSGRLVESLPQDFANDLMFALDDNEAAWLIGEVRFALKAISAEYALTFMSPVEIPDFIPTIATIRLDLIGVQEAADLGASLIAAGERSGLARRAP